MRLSFVGAGRDGEGKFVRRIGDRKQLGMQPHRRPGDRTRLEEFERFDMQRHALERLQEQFDVPSRRHDRGMVHAVLCQPRKVPLRQPRFEQQMFARYLMADQWAVGVLAQIEEHLVIAHLVGLPLIVARIAGQQVDNRFGARVLRGEV